MLDHLTSTVPFLSGLFVGAGGAWLLLRGRTMYAAQLSDNFKALAADTLRQNNEAFLQLAETRLKQAEQTATSALDKKATAIDEMVKPVKESLLKMDAQLQALELKREGAYRELSEMVKQSHMAQHELRGETSKLLQALRSPTSRGQWGEMQLKRILEMTGMSAHAKDFSAQHSIAEGTLRPDFIVSLPGDRCVIIDSKVPLGAYLDSMQASDDNARQASLKQHAAHIRQHVKALSNKAYWDQVEGTPEFVVLFLAGDHFLSAALDHDAELMDYSVAQKVILATPMTLIALLRTVAYGWRQESLRDNVRKIGALGADLYSALTIMTNHITSLGSKLSGALESYNNMIGSYDRNVLSKARKLKESGAVKDGKTLPEALEPIDLQPRSLTLNEAPLQEDAA